MNNDKTSLILELQHWICENVLIRQELEDSFGCWPTLKKAVNERTDSKKETRKKKIRNKKMKRKTESEKERKKRRESLIWK